MLHGVDGGGDTPALTERALTEHAWELTSADQHSESGRTRFEWRCRGCTSETFTYGAGKIGTHAADAHRPGRRALQGSWVDENCLQALVDRTHEL